MEGGNIALRIVINVVDFVEKNLFIIITKQQQKFVATTMVQAKLLITFITKPFFTFITELYRGKVENGRSSVGNSNGSFESAGKGIRLGFRGIKDVEEDVDFGVIGPSMPLGRV